MDNFKDMENWFDEFSENGHFFRSIFDNVNSFVPNSYKQHNWDELKKKGRVEEISKEEDGFITITRTFVSHDGKTKITEVDTSPTFSSQALRLMDIETELKEALEKEQYELCAKLKKERDQIKNNIDKNTIK